MLAAKEQEVRAKLAPLHERSTELRKELVSAEGQIATLHSQLREIELAIKALDEAQKKSGKLTIMQAVLEVLKGKSEGLTALEILAEINQRYFDGTVRRHSLSPQLSRLKDRDHKIDLRGDRWVRLPDEPGLFTPKS
jgi:predicted nuclease with TOPRIM domain